MLSTVCSTKCSSHNTPCRPQPTATTFTGSAKTFSDRAATDYGSGGWGPIERLEQEMGSFV
jgi:hypothetical protein